MVNKYENRRFISFLASVDRMNGKLARQAVKCKVGTIPFTGTKFYYAYKKGYMLNTRFAIREKSRTSAYSAMELAQQDKFRQAAAAVKLILSDPDQKRAAILDWKQNGLSYGTLRGYLMAREMANA